MLLGKPLFNRVSPQLLKSSLNVSPDLECVSALWPDLHQVANGHGRHLPHALDPRRLEPANGADPGRLPVAVGVQRLKSSQKATQRAAVLDSLQQFTTLVPNGSQVALDVFDLINVSLTVFPEVVVAGF